jgi:2-phosphosulfolactate phosphatase
LRWIWDYVYGALNHMEVRLGSLKRDAEEAQGTTIIIDVFRAFTTAAIAFDHGAKEITLFAEPEDALALHKKGVGDYLMGEVGGKKPNGFDFGNSPHEISQVDLTGKTLIQSTRAGTVGVEAAVNASEIFLGSFVVARATVDAIKAGGPELVSIIAMGDQGVVRADEDEHCGIYLRNILEGRKPDFAAVKSLVLGGGATQKFFDPNQPQYHPEDVTLALEADRYNFAMKVSREDGLLVAHKYDL